ncbi:MAG TPA: M20 family metallopeptidase [Acidimicrobiia bacterium]|nr:M20 family metallopeptidase [Acidimicrobiia bacterium]
MSRKEQATTAFSVVEPELREISKWMYENPELAHEEHASSERLARFLSVQGFDVSHPAYGIATAFEANVGSSGPRVVICAEYDALPEIGQACGHNIIATAALGAGVALVGLVDELGIRVTVLGTPAEEGGGGKIDLIDAGAFVDATASMMIHPSYLDILDPAVLAAQGFRATFRGKTAHAAGTPHLGINALDAFVAAYNNVSTLRQQFEPGDRVHGVIDEGGVAPNVIPDLTVSRWIVRATTASRFEELKPKVLACFEAAAKATGCELEIEFEGEPYIDLITNPLMAPLFAANSVALGRAMPTHAEVRPPGTGSTDMGNVSHVVPSIHPSIAIETDAVNHQAEFADATITPSGELALRDGALAMAHTIIDLAEHELWNQL